MIIQEKKEIEKKKFFQDGGIMGQTGVQIHHPCLVRVAALEAISWWWLFKSFFFS